MYKVQYSPFKRRYMVVSVLTGIAQSAWISRIEARTVCNMLNGVKYV